MASHFTNMNGFGHTQLGGPPRGAFSLGLPPGPQLTTSTGTYTMPGTAANNLPCSANISDPTQQPQPDSAKTNKKKSSSRKSKPRNRKLTKYDDNSKREPGNFERVESVDIDGAPQISYNVWPGGWLGKLFPELRNMVYALVIPDCEVLDAYVVDGQVIYKNLPLMRVDRATRKETEGLYLSKVKLNIHIHLGDNEIEQALAWLDKKAFKVGNKKNFHDFFHSVTLHILGGIWPHLLKLLPLLNYILMTGRVPAVLFRKPDGSSDDPTARDTFRTSPWSPDSQLHHSSIKKILAGGRLEAALALETPAETNFSLTVPSNSHNVWQVIYHLVLLAQVLHQEGASSEDLEKLLKEKVVALNESGGPGYSAVCRAAKLADERAEREKLRVQNEAKAKAAAEAKPKFAIDPTLLPPNGYAAVAPPSSDRQSFSTSAIRSSTGFGQNSGQARAADLVAEYAAAGQLLSRPADGLRLPLPSGAVDRPRSMYAGPSAYGPEGSLNTILSPNFTPTPSSVLTHAVSNGPVLVAPGLEPGDDFGLSDIDWAEFEKGLTTDPRLLW
jgi:hypothetical protein